MVFDIPLACVAAAFALIYLPRMLVARAQSKDAGGYDNKDPRDQQARLTGEAKRAQAAHMNAFETFAPFAVAVLGCEARHVDSRTVSILAVAFVVARLIYPWLYIKGIDRARSAVWMLGTLATFALMVLAAIGYA